MQTILFSEFFWSRASAEVAAARLRRKGYGATVRYAMRADMSHDWLVEVTEAE